MADELSADILASVEAEVGKMSKEDLMAELGKFRVRQKVQQKKQYGSGKQKEYQQKQRAKFLALRAMAQKLGVWEQIETEAEERAEQQLAAETTVAE
jgi:hypothetical protein